MILGAFPERFDLKSVSKYFIDKHKNFLSKYKGKSS
jgi:hypothetical protein